MKKVLVLMAGLLLIGANLYAGNGDLIVNGKVGVGTTTPQAELHIIDTDNDSWLVKWSRGGNVWGLASSAADGTGLFSANTGNMAWWASNNGYVGIGTATPGYQLQLSTNSAAKPSTNTWTIPSDERLKYNIKPFNDGLSVVLGINPVRYRYNGKGEIPDAEIGKDNIGVVAQEIQKVAPYTVGKFKAKLNKEDTGDTELLDFNSHALVFVLTNAIKEQQKQIMVQQEEIKGQQMRIEELEKKVAQLK